MWYTVYDLYRVIQKNKITTILYNVGQRGEVELKSETTESSPGTQ